MPSEPERKPISPEQHAQAAQNVADAHRLLSALRSRLDRHPELEKAILKLETALALLETQTGGML